MAQNYWNKPGVDNIGNNIRPQVTNTPRRPYAIALTIKSILQEYDRPVTFDELWNDCRIIHRGFDGKSNVHEDWLRGTLYGIHCSATWLKWNMSINNSVETWELKHEG